MSLMIDEQQGCAILRERFTRAGLQIQEDYPFSEGEITFNIDGFDPARRIGYEYITTAAGDREEITPAMVEALEQRMDEGGLFILLVDECDVESREALARAADRFLRAIGVLGGVLGGQGAAGPSGGVP